MIDRNIYQTLILSQAYEVCTMQYLSSAKQTANDILKSCRNNFTFENDGKTFANSALRALIKPVNFSNGLMHLSGSIQFASHDVQVIGSKTMTCIYRLL